MRLLLISGLAIVLISCTHDIALQTPDGQPVGKAVLAFEGNSSGTIAIDRNGEAYRGQWIASKVDESAKIASAYGIGSKKYKDYKRGWGKYLRAGQSRLQSDKGSILNCEFQYRGTNIHGSCKSETEEFEFIGRPE
ncbi:MAG: hypothetical protein ACKVOA_10530 [Methylophilaceae bacterium]